MQSVMQVMLTLKYLALLPVLQEVVLVVMQVKLFLTGMRRSMQHFMIFTGLMLQPDNLFYSYPILEATLIQQQV